MGFSWSVALLKNKMNYIIFILFIGFNLACYSDDQNKIHDGYFLQKNYKNIKADVRDLSVISASKKNSEENRIILNQISSKPELDRLIKKCNSKDRSVTQNIEHFFALEKIKISTGGAAYLVVPKNYSCSEFVAAHLVSYWIVEILKDEIRIVDSGQCDEIKFISSFSNGYRDFICQISWFSPNDKMIIRRFNGFFYE